MGLNVNDRRETWLFSEVETRQGRKICRRLKFNLVQYGDDPEQFLEPVNADLFEDIVGMAGPITANQATGGMGRFVGIQMMQGRLSPVHSFDDYDAATLGCSPTGI